MTPIYDASTSTRKEYELVTIAGEGAIQDSGFTLRTPVHFDDSFEDDDDEVDEDEDLGEDDDDDDFETLKTKIDEAITLAKASKGKRRS